MKGDRQQRESDLIGPTTINAPKRSKLKTIKSVEIKFNQSENKKTRVLGGEWRVGG